ncbi:MAG: DUF2865 domain-containing protein [Bauldia sp.]
MIRSPSLLARAFGAFATLIAGLGAAFAASPVCTQLEAQLASLSRSPASGGYQQFSDAAIQQRNELARAQAAAQQAGCSGGFLFFRPQQSPACDGLMANVERMRANLTRLEQSRDQYAYANGANSPARMRVLQSLGDAQCGPQYAPYASSRQGFFGLFGGPIYPPNSNFGFSGFDRGSYRTLCVRSCDGYYFPISFATNPSRFGVDAAVCKSLCPGSDVALYVHQNPGQDSEDMVSTTGQPYANQPFAFLYRQSYNPACSCNRSTPGTVAANGTFTPVPKGGVVVLGTPLDAGTPPPIPMRKPALGTDPETLANRGGDFTPGVVKPRTEGEAVADATLAAQRTVRQVGPSYFYAK